MDARRRRSRAVAAPLAAALAVAVSGCGSLQARGVCRDERTDQRVDDARCDRPGGGFGWWYFGSGARYPALGQPVSTAPGGSATPPAGARVLRGGAKADGGTVTKGGFGGRLAGGIGG